MEDYINRVFCSRCAIKLVTQGLKVEELATKLIDVRVSKIEDDYVKNEENPLNEEQCMEEMHQLQMEEEVDDADQSNYYEQLKKREELDKFLNNLKRNKKKNDVIHTRLLDKKSDLKQYYDK